MKLLRLEIRRWRSFRDVVLDIPEDANLVCLVGENGAGKSTVLELISALAHHLGISPGIEIGRGDPLNEPHDICVTAQLSVEQRTDVGDIKTVLANHGQLSEWNGRLVVRSQFPSPEPIAVVADGIDDPTAAAALAAHVVNRLRLRNETQHLYLDADRSYPPVQIQPHQFGDIWSQQWDSPEFTKGWAFRPTRALYEEWNKYFLGTEERAATEHFAACRRAAKAGFPPPELKDPFDGYRKAISSVLPHLSFVGVESSGAQRTILFDSSGLELTFNKLSGGEREIAFLVGQVERFQLRRGLLLIDEPELHLNPDLLRTWVAFLRDTVNDGQIWMATHSLEAVEVAGPECSFVFERDAMSTGETRVSSLAGRPVISVLSAALGAPAFSVGRLRFVYIEGARQQRERERFYAVAGQPTINRFVEGGSSSEVLQRVAYLRELADESSEQLRIAAVVDGDFRTVADAKKMRDDANVHVLGCNEIENVFLDPQALAELLRRAKSPLDANDTVRDASDRFAGLWLSQRADFFSPDLHETPKAAMTVWSAASWAEVDADIEPYISSSCNAFTDKDDRSTWEAALRAAHQAYYTVRLQPDLWKWCLGKQTFSVVAGVLGCKTRDVLERQVTQLWDDGTVLPPPPVIELRAYLEQVAVD